MCCCARLLDAQVVTGTITGVVSDDSRAVLPEVTITVTSPALPGGPVTTITNAQGAYRFSTLPPGAYEMVVSVAGFAAYVEKDLWVTVGGTIERNVTLGVATLAEAITVRGETPVVDPRQTGVSRSLGREADRDASDRETESHRLSGDASRRGAGQLQQRLESRNHGLQLN